MPDFGYIVSENGSGRFGVQRPNSFGGLYPVGGLFASVDLPDAFGLIANDADENGFTRFEIEIRYWHNPANEFGCYA